MLSRKKIVSLMARTWSPLSFMERCFESSMKGTTSSDGSEASTRTLRLAVPGNTWPRLFRTGDTVSFGSEVTVDMD